MHSFIARNDSERGVRSSRIRYVTVTPLVLLWYTLPPQGSSDAIPYIRRLCTTKTNHYYTKRISFDNNSKTDKNFRSGGPRPALGLDCELSIAHMCMFPPSFFLSAVVPPRHGARSCRKILCVQCWSPLSHNPGYVDRRIPQTQAFSASCASWCTTTCDQASIGLQFE